MTLLESKIGIVCPDFDTFKLKDILVKNDAGEWGADPDENAIGVLRSTNFTNEGKLTLDDVAYRKLSIDKINEKLLSANDILVERSGGSDTQPVGRVGFISEQIAKDKYAFANFIQRISLDDTVVSKYVYYCLQQMYEMGITASMQNQTTGIRNLDWKFYTQSIFPKPSLDEQKAIATILSKVDEAIESTKQTINSAQKLKTSLMQNLLTGKIKPDGTKRKDDEFYYDEKLGKVPKGWDVKNISNPTICKINPNYSIPKTTNEFPFLPMDAINDKFNGIGKIERISGSLSGYTKFKKHDILFAKITPSTENGKVALVDIEEEFEVGFASTEFLVFQPNQDFVEPKFLYYKLIKNDIHFLAVSLMEGTSGRQRVPWKIFRNRVFSAFPIDKNEQKAIADKISEIDNIITIKQNKIEKLENLKKSLMQNLLTGKMRLDEKLIKELISHV